MEIRDFIGKIVISTTTKKRYRLYEITAPTIDVVELQPGERGLCMIRRYHTINGDPFQNGELIFEDESLHAKFNEAYLAHCLSSDGRVEEYGYWLRRD